MRKTAAEEAREAREAGDALRDMLELIGVEGRVRLGAIGARRVVAIQPLSPGDARRIAEALTTSALTRRVTPTPGVAMWSASRRQVGEVVSGGRHLVRLRAIAGGEEWHSFLSDLRVARVAEIDAARRGGAPRERC